MNKTMNWYRWFSMMLKEFTAETTTKSLYEVVDIYECKKTGFTKAVIKLSGRHIIEKNISDIIVDNSFIEGLDKKTIRALTYMATVEQLKPDFSIVQQRMSNEVDDYILEIKSRNSQAIIKKTPLEVSKDRSLVSKFNSIEANRIGYLAGVRETVKEYKMLREKN